MNKHGRTSTIHWMDIFPLLKNIFYRDCANPCVEDENRKKTLQFMLTVQTNCLLKQTYIMNIYLCSQEK